MRENARRLVALPSRKKSRRDSAEKLDIRSFGEQVALLKRRFAIARRPRSQEGRLAREETTFARHRL